VRPCISDACNQPLRRTTRNRRAGAVAILATNEVCRHCGLTEKFQKIRSFPRRETHEGRKKITIDPFGHGLTINHCG